MEIDTKNLKDLYFPLEPANDSNFNNIAWNPTKHNIGYPTPIIKKPTFLKLLRNKTK